MQNVALAWFVYELTHSPLAVGILTFCRFSPQTLFGLFAGVLADRFDNRRLVIGTQAASMAVSVVLAGLALSGVAQVWHVYVLAVFAGIAQVFDSPGRHALVYQMVGRAELPNAIALNTSVFNASRIIGPGIAGLLIASVGVGACFALNAVSFVAVLAALLLMNTRELHPVERPEQSPTLFRGVREGLAYARARPACLARAAARARGRDARREQRRDPAGARGRAARGARGLRAALGGVRRRGAARRARHGHARAGELEGAARRDDGLRRRRCCWWRRRRRSRPVPRSCSSPGCASRSGARTRTRSCS